MSSPTYTMRPGRLADVPTVTRLYMASFGKEPLLDYMFPTRHTDDTTFYTWTYRRFQARYWDQTYILTVVVDDGDRPVAFSWWERPAASLTFADRFLTPMAWVSLIVKSYISVRDYLFPIRGIDPHRTGIYQRSFNIVKPSVLNTRRRQQAWYLSHLCVDPKLQGKGLGGMLLREGLQQTDHLGVASWLCGLEGLENYYCRYGFVEVARANVGELKDWRGGSIMFRE